MLEMVWRTVGGLPGQYSTVVPPSTCQLDPGTFIHFPLAMMHELSLIAKHTGSR